MSSVPDRPIIPVDTTTQWVPPPLPPPLTAARIGPPPLPPTVLDAPKEPSLPGASASLTSTAQDAVPDQASDAPTPPSKAQGSSRTIWAALAAGVIALGAIGSYVGVQLHDKEIERQAAVKQEQEAAAQLAEERKLREEEKAQAESAARAKEAATLAARAAQSAAASAPVQAAVAETPAAPVSESAASEQAQAQARAQAEAQQQRDDEQARAQAKAAQDQLRAQAEAQAQAAAQVRTQVQTQPQTQPSAAQVAQIRTMYASAMDAIRQGNYDQANSIADTLLAMRPGDPQLVRLKQYVQYHSNKQKL